MKFWDNIDDLPVYYYAKIIKTGDLRYLQYGNSEKKHVDESLAQRLVNLITRKRNESEAKEIRTLYDAWKNIEQQIIDINIDIAGYKDMLLSQKMLILKEIRYALSGKAIDKLNFEIAKTEAEKKQVKKTDIHEAITLVERHLKIQINEKNMSVKRFFLHLKYFTNNGGQN